MKQLITYILLCVSVVAIGQNTNYSTQREIDVFLTKTTNATVRGSVYFTEDVGSGVIGISPRTTAGKGGDLIIHAQRGLLAGAESSADGGDVFIYGGEDDGNVLLSPTHGAVGIRLDDPQATLHVNGTFRMNSPYGYFEFSTISGGGSFPDTLTIEYNGVIVTRIPPR